MRYIPLVLTLILFVVELVSTGGRILHNVFALTLFAVLFMISILILKSGTYKISSHGNRNYIG